MSVFGSTSYRRNGQEVRSLEAPRPQQSAFTRTPQKRVSTRTTLRNPREPLGISPILRLPGNILREIFMYHLVACTDVELGRIVGTHGFDEGRVHDVQLPFRRHRATLSQVCCSWRRLTSNIPLYWDTIHKAHPVLVSKLLMRSGDLPITVRWASASSDTSWSLAGVLRHLHRVERLELAIPRDALAAIALSMPRTVHKLTSLTLIDPRKHGVLGPDLPQTLLACKMPQLTHVTLIDYRITRWSLPSHITHLTIQSTRVHGVQTIELPFHQTMDILSNLCFLNHLVLTDCLRASPESPLPQPPNQYTPRTLLDSLRISAPALSVGRILAHLEAGIAPSASVHLIYTENWVKMEDHDNPNSASSIQEAMSVAAQSVASKIVLAHNRPAGLSAAFLDDEGSLQLHLWSFITKVDDAVCRISSSENPPLPGSLTITVQLPRSATARVPLLTHFFPTLSLTKVLTLHLDCGILDGKSPRVFVALFQSMPRLLGLSYVDNGGCGSLRRALMTEIPQQVGVEGQRFILTGLKDIRVWTRDLDATQSLRARRNNYVAFLMAIAIRSQRREDFFCLRVLEITGMQQILDSFPLPPLRLLRWIRERMLDADQGSDWLVDDGEQDHSPLVPCPWFDSVGRVRLEELSGLLPAEAFLRGETGANNALTTFHGQGQSKAMSPAAILSLQSSFTSGATQMSPPKTLASSIFRLCDDILRKVFLYVTTSCGKWDDHSFVCNTTPSIRDYVPPLRFMDHFTKSQLRITSVCRLWRQIALLSPNFWSVIIKGHPGYISESLKRSCRTTLDVRWFNHGFRSHEGENKGTGSLQDVLNALDRIQCLELSVPRSIYLQIITDKLPQYAPLLRSLTLINPFTNLAAYSPLDAIDFISDLPTFLDHCQMPNLERVKIIGYCLDDWSTMIFPSSLTHLHIQAYRDFADFIEPFATASFEETLNLLSRMHHLTNLILSDCLDAPLDGVPISNTECHPRVTLPDLTYLRLSAPLLTCSHFLYHLSFPSTSAVFIIFTPDRSGEVGLEEATDVVSRCVFAQLGGPFTDGRSRPIFRNAALTWNLRHYGIHLFQDSSTALDDCTSDEGLNYPGSVRVLVSLSPRDSVDQIQRTRFLAKVVAPLPLTHVETIYIHSQFLRYEPQQNIVAFLQRLPLVTTLAVADGTGAGGIRRALMAQEPGPPDVGGANTTRPFLLPRLRDFRLELDRGDVDLGYVQLRDAWIMLLVALVRRYTTGLWLDRLQIPALETMMSKLPLPTFQCLLWIQERVQTFDYRYDDFQSHQYPGKGLDEAIPMIPFPKQWFDVHPKGCVNIGAVYSSPFLW